MNRISKTFAIMFKKRLAGNIKSSEEILHSNFFLKNSRNARNWHSALTLPFLDSTKKKVGSKMSLSVSNQAELQKFVKIAFHRNSEEEAKSVLYWIGRVTRASNYCLTLR